MPLKGALVIGAGPAGSAAARLLAQSGVRVALVDRHPFPRDKVCGDALIPDALQALDELGLGETVRRIARPFGAIRVYSPGGRCVVVNGACACVPRIVLDRMLLDAARDAGADFIPFVKALWPLIEGDRIVGATVEDVRSGAIREMRADATILGTGAAAEVLQRFEVCLRIAPSAIAARVYVRVPPSLAAQYDHLAISYSAAICPGYGWVFPGPSDVFNVGIGLPSGLRPIGNGSRPPNLRQLLDEFVASFPPANALMRYGQVLTPLKGAPLRMGLSGARLSRPGLLVVGEAAGLTYSFTGEGIGKALQSGIIAARVLQRTASADVRTMRAAADEYDAQVRSAFGHRFRAYQRLERLLSYPRIVDLLAHRATAGTYVRSQMEALLNETGRADGLVSLTGIIRALIS